MSTEPVQEDGNEMLECRNAREYALQRVEEEDGEILKSEDLAEEYSCTKDHMQTVLRELSRDGEIKRVGWGRYAAISGDSEEENSGYQREKADDIPSGDGGVRSQATDMTETYPDGEEPIQCPADGCEYEGFSVEGFRKHSNAVRNHDWEDIKDELDRAELSDFERSEDLQEETEMVADQELQIQRDFGIEDVDEDDSVQLVEDDRDDQDNTEGEEIVEGVTETTQKGIPLPVSSTVLIVAVVVAIAALWLFTRDGSNSEPEQEQQNQQDDIFGDGRGLI